MNTTVCPKCRGKKRLNEFRRVDAGTCFLCKGHGEIACRTDWQHQDAEVTRKRRWLLSATDDQLRSLSTAQIQAVRRFVDESVRNDDRELEPLRQRLEAICGDASLELSKQP